MTGKCNKECKYHDGELDKFERNIDERDALKEVTDKVKFGYVTRSRLSIQNLKLLVSSSNSVTPRTKGARYATYLQKAFIACVGNKYNLTGVHMNNHLTFWTGSATEP